MPLTPQQKAELLQKHDVDPTKFWLNDSGDIVELNATEGPTQSAVKSAVVNAPSTTLGFTGGALGIAGGTALGGPTILGAPVAGLAGMGAGAMAGANLGQRLQKALYPETMAVEEARQFNAPVASRVGQAIASTAFMRPSVRDIRSLAQIPGTLMRSGGAPLPPALKNVAANALVGAGTSAGMAAGMGDSKEGILAEGLLGLLQTRVTGPGRLASFGIFNNPKGYVAPREAGQGLEAPVREPEAPTPPAVGEEEINRLMAAMAKQEKLNTQNVRKGEEAVARQQANEAAAQRRAEVEAAMKQRTATGEEMPDVTLRDPRTTQVDPNPPVARRVENLDKGYTIEGESPTTRGNLTDATVGEVGRPTQSGTPPEGTRLSVDKRTPDQRLAESREAGIPITPAENTAPREVNRAPVEGEPGYLDYTENLAPNENLWSWWRDFTESRMRGTFKVVDQIPGNKAGAATERKGFERAETQVAKNSYTDTAPHEQFHRFFDDVLEHGTPREKKFIEDAFRELGIEILPNKDGIRQIAASEEQLIQALGEATVRHMRGDGERAMDALKDFTSYYWNNRMTPEAAKRMLRNRLLYGAGTEPTLASAEKRLGRTPTVRPSTVQPAEERPAAPAEPAAKRAVERPVRQAERDLQNTEPAEEGAAIVDDGEAPGYQPSNEPTRYTYPEDEAQAAAAAQRRAEMSAEERRRNVREFENERSPAQEEGDGTLTQEERDFADMQRFGDTGGDMPLGRESLPEPDQFSDLPNPRSDEIVDRPQIPEAPRLVGSARRAMERARSKEMGKIKREVQKVKPDDLTDVNRPENRDYSGESIPSGIRRGRANAQNARESAEDLDMRRIEDRLSGRDRSRYQPLGPDRLFSTDFAKELDKPNPMKLQVGKDGKIHAGDVRVQAKKLNTVEQELLREAGFEEFLSKNPRVSLEELKAFARNAMPEVEVKELAAVESGDTISNVQSELATMRHEWYDNLNATQKQLVRQSINDGDYHPQLERELSPESVAKAKRYIELSLIEDGTIDLPGNKNNDSATRQYTQVNPRELDDMPNAVDLLVRMPAKKVAEYADRDAFESAPYRPERAGRSSKMHDESGKLVEREQPKYPASSTHFPQSGDNLLAHVRAYEHTMPDGERVLRVFEVQSDWAQARRKEYDRLVKKHMADSRVTKEQAERYLDKVIADNPDQLSVPNDPLLSVHQRLALKAAIEHARKLGIKKVVVDDAETAMITEGHDRMIDRARKDVADANADLAEFGDDARSSYGVTGTLSKLEKRYKEHGAKFEIQDGKIVMTRGPFEGGMKLSYDNVLQQQMRDLSGDGVKVELGEHKNALAKDKRSLVERMPWEAVHRDTGEIIRGDSEAHVRRQIANRRGEWDVAEVPVPDSVGKVREDLIFKNPDGTPKTTSTGYAYDVSAAQARRAAGEPFSMTNKRYQPLGPEEGRYKGAGLPDRTPGGRAIFAGNTETLRRSGDPDRIYFADKADALYNNLRAMEAKYADPILKAWDDLGSVLPGITKAQRHLYETMHQEQELNKSLRHTLNAKQQKSYDVIRATLKQMRLDQNAAGQTVSGRAGKVDPFYFPHIPDASIMNDLTQGINTPRFKALRQQFIDYNADRFAKTMPRAEAVKQATEAFGKYSGTLKPATIEGGFDFGAVTLAANTKLPPTWINPNPTDAFRRYIKNFARARAFYDTIQRDERAMKLVGRDGYYDKSGKFVKSKLTNDSLARDRNVRALLEQAIGVTHESQEGVTPAIGRLANSLILSNVATRLVDATTTPFKALAFIPAHKIPGLLLNMRHMKQSMANAYKTGGLRRGDNMVLRDVLGAGDQFIRGMDRVTQAIISGTGSGKLEQGARIMAQNVGEYLYDVNRTLAMKGDKRSTEFLNKVSKEWRTLSREEVSQQIAQIFQGKYDATNLPIWIQNSPAAPFFSMMKWNIEQWNNFKKFGYEPATKGDLVPLMKMLAFGVIGGAATAEVREAITGKKPRVADWSEIAAGMEDGATGPAAQEAMRKLAYLSAHAGTVGIVNEMMLQMFDVAAKENPQGMSWPAMEMAGRTLKHVSSAYNAIVDKPRDGFLVLKELGSNIMKENFTMWRLVANQLDSTQVDAANERRDLRVSDRMAGEDLRQSPMIPFDYSTVRERQFDNAETLDEARPIARDLVAGAKADARNRADLEDAKRKFRTMRISGMPSKANDPKRFKQHVEFIRRTQGAEAADSAVERYKRKVRLNEQKKRLIR
jgi:hypothetical protein